MNKAFSFRLLGYFYAQPLYNRYGSEVYTLADAIEAANYYTEKWGEQWAEVFNGDEGIHHDDLDEMLT